MKQHILMMTEFAEITSELPAAPMWMVQPLHCRKYAGQRMLLTAEVVDIDELDLEQMKTFETR